ncbi:hypothetical protein BDF19DRAFT_462758 [Syncephalis fuscata]|nr:hypothetical protein BDF19DRAFT_462758 [Syncephalis fuscata]
MKSIIVYLGASVVWCGVSCMAQTMPSRSSSSLYETKTFLSQVLKQKNAFGKPGLRIVEVEKHERNVPMARGTFNGASVSIECPNAQEQLYNQYQAIDLIKKAMNQIPDAYKDGSEFIALPLLEFGHHDRYCYVTSRQCDIELMEYKCDDLMQNRAKGLQNFFMQMLRGIAFMHRIHLLMSDFNPEDICINSKLFGKSKIIIRKFSNSVPFSVIDDHSLIIGKVIYKTLSNNSLPPYYTSQAGPLNSFYISVIERTSFRPTIAKSKEILQPLVDMINVLVEHDFNDRPTPEDYINFLCGKTAPRSDTFNTVGLSNFQTDIFVINDPDLLDPTKSGQLLELGRIPSKDRFTNQIEAVYNFGFYEQRGVEPTMMGINITPRNDPAEGSDAFTVKEEISRRPAGLFQAFGATGGAISIFIIIFIILFGQCRLRPWGSFNDTLCAIKCLVFYHRPWSA